MPHALQARPVDVFGGEGACKEGEDCDLGCGDEIWERDDSRDLDEPLTASVASLMEDEVIGLGNGEDSEEGDVEEACVSFIVWFGARPEVAMSSGAYSPHPWQ